MTVLHCLQAGAQQSSGRMNIGLNKGWLFVKQQDTSHAKWQSVNIPHTWNIEDVMDDEPGYYRGIGWYKKQLFIPSSYKGKYVQLRFEAANQEAEVFVNKRYAGKHAGGYTAFNIRIDTLLQYGTDNEILVKVDNRFNESIPPLTADFTFYGGIYRSVSLQATGRVHFACNDHASPGVYVTTPAVTAKQATVAVKAMVENDLLQERNVQLLTVLKDASGKVVATQTTKVNVLPQQSLVVMQQLPRIAMPKLWSPETPYLYTLQTQVQDAATHECLDNYHTEVGFRWFRFDAAKGFFLNDKHYKLVGTSRHQDFKGLGNAVDTSIAVRDVELLKAMGGNFLRVAHYPQDPVVLQACDRLGILASVEIPVVNEITETAAFTNNCRHMLKEMIRQNYNHPSVIIWCYMNEVLLKPHFNNDTARQRLYFNNIYQLAAGLDSLTRKEDPARYTMIANHGDFKKYKDVGLVQLPMLAGWNLYSGWYGNKMEEFAAALDRHHTVFPDKPLLVTEYGADADPRIRSFAPQRFDKSVEYTTGFHQYYMKAMLQRDFVAAAMVWNLADFNSETRTESMPHINNKGLLTWDRIPKDPYFLYKALLAEQAYVKILSTDWKTRTVLQDSNGTTCTQPLQIAANTDSVQVSLNGKSMGMYKVSDGLAACLIPFQQGSNLVAVTALANGKKYIDTATFFIQAYPLQLTTKVEPLHIMLGSERFYMDPVHHLTWIPSKPYSAGSWGHIGGKPYKMQDNNRLPYGTDKNIVGTDDDPVYQTQQNGIEQYRFDVPPGNYEIQLHFAELLGPSTWPIPYNLNSGPAVNETLTRRVFDVTVNGKTLLENFDMAGQYGVSTAIRVKVMAIVKGSEGLVVSFLPREGTTVLNAIELKRVN